MFIKKTNNFLNQLYHLKYYFASSYYAILNVSSNATQQEIKNSYYKLGYFIKISSFYFNFFLKKPKFTILTQELQMKYIIILYRTFLGIEGGKCVIDSMVKNKNKF